MGNFVSARIYTLLVPVWGAFDILFVIWYVTTSLTEGRFPFYSDVAMAYQTVGSYGLSAGIAALLSAMLYLTIPLSGVLLILRRRAVKNICYIQAPFRIALFVPSIFILFWPLKFFPHMVALALSGVLLLLTEGFKVVSLHCAFVRRGLS